MWIFSIFRRGGIPWVVASNNVDICLRQVYCDSNNYPENYKLVDDAKTTECKDKMFTKDR